MTRLDVVVAERPDPATPRPYDFPHVRAARLANGLTVLDRRPARPRW